MDLIKDIDKLAKLNVPIDQIDEMHPTTYRMLRSMGDKSPEETTKKHKDSTKKSIKVIMKKAKEKMGWK